VLDEWEIYMNGLVIPARPVRRLLLGLGLAVLLLLGTVAAGVLVLSERVGNNVVRIPAVFASLNESTRPPMSDEQTFLLIGTDSRSAEPVPGTAAAPVSGAQPTDTLMIAQISADERSVTVVSIPGDSWIDIPGRGFGTINSAYSTGAPGLLVETVEQLTAWRVDHVAVVDFARSDAVVDSMHGVDMAVAHHVNGAWALEYVQQRDGLPGGDADRAARQQDLLRAMLSKVITSGTLSSPVGLYGLLDATSHSVSLDDTLTNGGMRSLAFDMLGIGPADFTLLRAPVGAMGREGAQSVLYLDRARAAELWESLRNGTTAGYAERHPEDLFGAAPR
jgi:anionic cell wall polymer biosynthesis LytR-Cps2A-Psr (LCP) family protein